MDDERERGLRTTQKPSPGDGHLPPVTPKVMKADRGKDAALCLTQAHDTEVIELLLQSVRQRGGFIDLHAFQPRRMRRRVDIFQRLNAHPRVDLGGADIGVT